jgi:hypothetical protein
MTFLLAAKRPNPPLTGLPKGVSLVYKYSIFLSDFSAAQTSNVSSLFPLRFLRRYGMARFATLALVVVAFTLLPSLVAAQTTPRITAQDVFRLLTSDPTIPAEWAGIWSIVDTSRFCGGMLLGTSAELDTLCSGQPLDLDDPDDPIGLSCSGTVTSTVVDITCTGSFEAFPDCQADIVVKLDATRTGESYVSVSTITTSFSGTGVGCDLNPDICITTTTHGNRTAPEPIGYCSTQIEPTSWGRLKSHYR